MRKWLLGLAALLILSALILFYTPAYFIWLGFGSYLTRPSDEELAKQFDKKRSILEQIVVLMDEDRNMSRIAPDFTWRENNLRWPRPESEWGISKERWDLYNKLFRESGVGGVTRRDKSSDIQLDVWSWGLAVAGTDISLLYCGKPSNSYQHTEAPCVEGKAAGDKHVQNGEGYRYKKIAPDWYIYEESD